MAIREIVSPERRYDLHYGVKPNNRGMAVTYARLLNAADWYVDGDGWNCWGEAPGTDINDADTLHAVARFNTIGQAIDGAIEMRNRFSEDLVPSNGISADAWGRRKAELLNRNDANGTLLVVSSAVDWAEQFFVVAVSGTSTMKNSHYLNREHTY